MREHFTPREREAREEVRSRIKMESNDESLGYLLGAIRDGSVFYDKASRNYFTMYYQKHREWLEESISPRMERRARSRSTLPVTSD
nr:MAG: hypothetical protein AM324_09295 [Candidatus Thorarchaeota archaeon SMTZ1-83]